MFTFLPCVSESHSTVPPRITHREEEVKVQLGETAFLPCAAEAFPVPTHRWYKQESGRTIGIVTSQRIFLMGGTLVFRRALVIDSGKYVCLVNNSIGQERVETDLIVVGKFIFIFLIAHVIRENYLKVFSFSFYIFNFVCFIE